MCRVRRVARNIFDAKFVLERSMKLTEASDMETLEIPLEDAGHREGGGRFALQPPAHDKQGARVSIWRLPLSPAGFSTMNVLCTKALIIFFLFSKGLSA